LYKVHWKNPFSCREENQALQTPQTFFLVATAPSLPMPEPSSEALGS
jgi:hypothetical protein